LLGLGLKDDRSNVRFPSLVKVVSLLFALPDSNAIAERLLSKLKNNKTDKRNRLKDLTVAALIKIKDWLKSHYEPLHQIITFSDDILIIFYVLKLIPNFNLLIF
jgi:hypothetical protein